MKSWRFLAKLTLSGSLALNSAFQHQEVYNKPWYKSGNSIHGEEAEDWGLRSWPGGAQQIQHGLCLFNLVSFSLSWCSLQ